MVKILAVGVTRRLPIVSRLQGFSEREIVIDRKGEIKNEDVKKLIESLTSANAESILILKD